MTILATNSSVTLTVPDDGYVKVSTNGGFATVQITEAGQTRIESIGPLAFRGAYGGFKEGATVVITNTSAYLDYELTINNFNSLVLLTGSRDSLASDSGDPIANDSASNYTVNIVANTIGAPTTFQQESTGTITLTAGSGVTFIGATLATTGAGSMLTVIPTTTRNRYIVVKGGL